MLDYEQYLMQLPAEVAFGYSSVSICRPSELRERQVGFSIHPDGTNLCGDGDGDWLRNWLVIGFEGECGDPIFIDKAAPGYPVYTVGHGEGRWDLKPIAVSLDGLRAALAAVTKAAEGRETPVALEQRPISAEERDAILAQIQQHNPGIDLFFWALMMDGDLEHR